ncbi:hypothetical protein ACSBR2_035621 [Camellia fascicularis]
MASSSVQRQQRCRLSVNTTANLTLTAAEKVIGDDNLLSRILIRLPAKPLVGDFEPRFNKARAIALNRHKILLLLPLSTVISQRMHWRCCVDFLPLLSHFILEMEEEGDYEEYVRVAKHRAMEAQKILQQKGKSLAFEDETEKSKLAEAKPSLLVKATQLKRDQPEISPTEQIVQQEKEMIEHLSDRKTLMSVRELAKGITYEEPLLTGWKPPLRIRRMSTKD